MLKYAKYISETQIQFPTAAEFPGIPNWQTHDKKLRDKGYVALEGVPEDRPGFSTVLDRFSFTPKKTTRREKRQVLVEDWEEDPETHERRKTGEHYEMQDQDIEVDVSFITVLEYHYEELPAPEPEPTPVVRYSKYKIQLACQARGLWTAVKDAIAAANLQDSWSNIVDIASDNESIFFPKPNVSFLFVFRATQPSMESKMIAININMAASSKF